MTSFRHLKSVIRLNELAEDPIDLTSDGMLTPKRIDSMVAEAAKLKLFYATERVSDNVLGALYDLAEETQALKKMEAMQTWGKLSILSKAVKVKKGRPSTQRCAIFSTTGITSKRAAEEATRTRL